MSQILWYSARAGGIVAYALLTATVVWGLALSTRVLGKRPKPAWLLDLHRWLGGAALAFTLVHVVSILFDTYVHFGIVNVLVPFTGTWNPSAVAWGIIGFYVLLTVELTSLARRRLPQRLWRSVHYASFPLFALTTVHTLAAGTDSGTAALQVGVIVAVVAVAGLTAIRVTDAVGHLDGPPERTKPRPPADDVPQPRPLSVGVSPELASLQSMLSDELGGQFQVAVGSRTPDVLIVDGTELEHVQQARQALPDGALIVLQPSRWIAPVDHVAIIEAGADVLLTSASPRTVAAHVRSLARRHVPA